MSLTTLGLRYEPQLPTESDRRERDIEAARAIDHVKMTLNEWLSEDSIFKPDDGLGTNPTKRRLLESNQDWVYACVTAIAGRVMSLPFWLELQKRLKTGVETTIVEQHVFVDLLENPNPVTTGAELRWMLACDLELAGDAYWWLIPDGSGRWPTQIWRIPPDAVWTIYDGRGQMPLQHLIQLNGATWKVDPQWLVMFRLPGGVDNPWHGSLSPLQASARAMDLNLFSQIYQSNFYKNNARPDFLITFPPNVKINQETLKAFKSKWDSSHKGLDASHKWGVLGDGADIKTISMSDGDRRYIEVSDMTRDKILAAFKVPAAKIGLTTDANRANSESADYTFNRECIAPLATLIASAVNKHIIDKFYQPERTRGAKLVFKFDNPIPKDEERTQRLLLDLMSHGILTPNEVAGELGWSEFDGGEQRIIKTGLIPYEQLGLSGMMGAMGGVLPPAPPDDEQPKVLKAKSARLNEKRKYGKMKTVDVWREINRAVAATGKVPYDAHLELFARHVKSMKPHVKPFKKELADAFRDQSKRVLDQVQANYGKALAKIQPGKTKAAVLKFVRKELLNPNDYLDLEYEIEVFYTLNLKHLTDMFLDALGATFLELTGEQRELLTSRARRWLDTFSRKYAKDVTDTTAAAIKEIIREGLVEGWSVDDAAGKIETLYEGFTDWRSEMIARTELNAASNAGSHEGMKQSGLVAREQWLSALDERTRRAPTSEFDHWVANGEIAPIDGYFTKTGGRLAFPGDPEGEPGNIINCFVDGQTKIFTSNGWVNISNIQPGMMVLAHTGKFKPVTRVLDGPTYSGDVIRIAFDASIRSLNKTLLVTPEHPILTERGWVNAGEIRPGDVLQMAALPCPSCGKPVNIYKRTPYCSKNCASRIIAKRQWADPKHRENISQKTSDQLHREYANGIRDKHEITKQARRVGFEKYGHAGYLGAFGDKARKLGHEAIVKKYGSRLAMIQEKVWPKLGMVKSWTKIEMAMAEFLTRNGKPYIPQYAVGRRRVDFYVPSEKMFIECDGESFHQDKDREIRRDVEILTQYPDHRIAHVKYPNKGKRDKPEWTFSDLQTLNHDGQYSLVGATVTGVTRQKLGKPRKLYNFAVDGDESYVAKGVVVHNCRCTVIPVIEGQGEE